MGVGEGVGGGGGPAAPAIAFTSAKDFGIPLVLGFQFCIWAEWTDTLYLKNRGKGRAAGLRGPSVLTALWKLTIKILELSICPGAMCENYSLRLDTIK